MPPIFQVQCGTTFTWQKGRQLASISNADYDLEFRYNSDGLRTRKISEDKTIEYYYSGDALVAQYDGTNWMKFVYSADGEMVGFTYQNKAYYYIKNIQGDVMAIADSYGTIIAFYMYGAWGNPTPCDDCGDPTTDADEISVINPIRYRGYYYDSETGLYYLQSRYYNPEWGRFINADDSEILFEEQEHILEHNLFAYCLNDPINMLDETGESSIAVASSYAAWTIVGGSNIWNPVGWVAVGVLATTAAVYVGIKIYDSVASKSVSISKSKSKSKNSKGKKGRPGLKKQGREDLEKKKIKIGKKGQVKNQEHSQDPIIQAKKGIESIKREDMRHLWLCNDWSSYISVNCRKGIRLRFDQGVDSEVLRACKEFVTWLRKEYEFPIRVPIYFKNTKYIKSQNGQFASAVFLGPYDKSLEPYIRIAVDDYYDMLTERGKDNALASILHSIAHELSHYFQWIKDIDSNKLNTERQAKYYADEILLDYAETREHP